jgi:hypothetical protein
MAKKLYECQNAACTLGIMGEAGGKFTGGLSDEQRKVLGLAEDHPTGDGICPNCGKKGKEVGTH